MEINKEQIEATKRISENIGLIAGAGTGKTKVLTDRYVYILEHGSLEKYKEIESIVAITFTKKASDEMISRIRKELRSNFHRGEEWKRYYKDLGKANISTIHSFCAKILRKNPIEIGIDPNFEILDEYVSKNILNESIGKVLNTKIKEESFLNMVMEFKAYNLNIIGEELADIYTNLKTTGVSLLEVKTITLNYLNSLKLDEKDIEEIKNIVKYLVLNSRKNSKIYKLGENPDWLDFSQSNYKKSIYDYLNIIKKNMGSSVNERERFERLEFLLNKTLMCKHGEYIWLYEKLIETLEDIDREYSQGKLNIGALDYDDLQNKTLQILNIDSIRKKYQEKYRYFMIDEFQDSNEIQRKIFYKLASIDEKLDRENFFVVGDPKQSIYGFRGGDVDVFYGVIDDIKKFGEENAITLKKNYRSLDTIVDFVNYTFDKLMKDDYDPLIPNRYNKKDLEIEIIKRPENDNTYTSLEDSIYEGQMIAKRISQLVSTGEYSYKDFGILFRSTTRTYVYEEALKEMNIPYINTSSKKYFHRQEVYDVLNALKFINNPYDKISGIGFLRSPMIGLSDISIYKILNIIGENLYKNIENSPEYLDDNLDKEEIDKIDRFKRIFEYLYEIKDISKVSELMERLIEKTYFSETLSSQDGYIQKISNIYKLIDLAKEDEKQGLGFLGDFIEYIEEIRHRDEAEGIIQSESSDAVNLLTIHKSKGLQFRVVAIPEMAKSTRTKYGKILFDKNLGLGINTENTLEHYEMIKKNTLEKDMEESGRVLYVAMTRAEDLLILGYEGKDSGFKKIIQDFLNIDNYKVLEDIEIEDIEKKEIRRDDLFNPPLLYGIKEKDQNHFERYNISQYLSYKECKRKFYLDYYKKIDINSLLFESKDKIEETNILSPLEKGNIVHKFCEDYRSNHDREDLTKDIVNSFGIEYTERVRQELKIYLDNFIRSYREDYDEIYREQEFYLKIRDKYLYGIIDRINIKNGFAEIVDYKTNKTHSIEELIDYYTPQIQIYAYVIEKTMNIKVNKGKILFLSSNQEVLINIDSSALDDNFKKIQDFVDFVESKNRIEEYKKTSICSEYCPHIEFCKLIF